jgi:nucleoside-diphosphate-sugar epimerase
VSDAPALVTGGSGFVAMHWIRKLLSDGLGVRTTLRTPGREGAVCRLPFNWLGATGKPVARWPSYRRP